MSKTKDKVLTRDIKTGSSGHVTTYSFPKLGVSVEAGSLAEAQLKAAAKSKSITQEVEDNNE